MKCGGMLVIGKKFIFQLQYSILNVVLPPPPTTLKKIESFKCRNILVAIAVKKLKTMIFIDSYTKNLNEKNFSEFSRIISQTFK